MKKFKFVKYQKPVRVDFYTKEGEKIAFLPNQKVSKPMKVEFYQRNKKQKMKKEITERRKAYNRVWMREWRHGKITKGIAPEEKPSPQCYYQKNREAILSKAKIKGKKRKTETEKRLRENLCIVCGRVVKTEKWAKAHFCSFKCWEV